MEAQLARRHGSARESVVAGVIFGVATVAVAGVGSVATAQGMDWYDGLERPSFTPPDATFGIVWTILYAAIAVAGWLAWRSTTRPAPTVWWAVQMALNLSWTIAFFGVESPVAGGVVIAALLLAVAIHVSVVAKVNRSAAALLMPYFIWCAFAAALTIGVAVLN